MNRRAKLAAAITGLVLLVAGLAAVPAQAAGGYTVVNRTGGTITVCLDGFNPTTGLCSNISYWGNGSTTPPRAVGVWVHSRYGLGFNGEPPVYGPQWVGRNHPAGTYVVTQTQTAAQRILGTPRSGGRWHSGVWTGAPFTVAEVESFGTWRGTPPDVVTAYSMNQDWNTLATNFWSIAVYEHFAGRLNYSLAPIPISAEPPNAVPGQLTAAETETRRANMREVASGARDSVYQAQALALVDHGHGDAIVRIAWESNYLAHESSANHSLRADYIAMWRRVATVMNAAAPELVFEFNVNGGGPLVGSSDRLGPWQLYPGDDVVDLIGIDLYDWYSTQTYGTDDSRMLYPAPGPGVVDALQFARAHGKGFALSEWGLSNGNGQGDNPAYITAIDKVLTNNRDVVVYEAYFDDGQHDFRGNNFANSAAVYTSKW